LDANDRLNWQLIRDNAYVGIHEMTVTGKALTQALYGVAPRYSYFNGCSTATTKFKVGHDRGESPLLES
jgi:hypothetical protein